MAKKMESAKSVIKEMKQLQSRLDEISIDKASSGNIYNLSWLQENEIRDKILKCRNTLRRISGAV